MVEGVSEKFGAFVHQQIVWAKDRGILPARTTSGSTALLLRLAQRPTDRRGFPTCYPSTIWNIPTVKVGKTDHPTSKPIEVSPCRCASTPGEVCSSRSGPRLAIVAGETTGRRVFAIEISPQYIDVAVKRWQTVTDKRATLTATAARSTRSPANGCRWPHETIAPDVAGRGDHERLAGLRRGAADAEPPSTMPSASTVLSARSVQASLACFKGSSP